MVTLATLYDAASTRWLVHYYPVQARQIQELAWVQDGLSALERSTIDEFTVMADFETDALDALLAAPWMRDGLSGVEARAVDYLEYFSEFHAYSGALLAMPFLSTVELADAEALELLGWLAFESEEEFLKILGYPALRDGITDQWAKALPTITSAENADDPSMVERLFSPSHVSLEERRIRLPLTGATDLILVRVDVEGSDESMDIAADVLMELESIMAAPFPTPHIRILIADGGWHGLNAGTHVAIDPKFDENPQVDQGLRHLLMHEVGHYFWGSGRPWIDEGIANTLADLFQESVSGRNVYLERNFDGCDKTIEDLDIEGSVSGLCHYHLGTQLFMELFETLGEEGFHEGLRDLYALSLSQGPLEVSELRVAFSDVAAMKIIDRWYYGPK